MWLKIKNKFRYYKLCFHNWLNGDGFRVLLDPKSQCFYEYCANVALNEDINTIAAYEKIIAEFAEKEKISREEAAYCFSIAYVAILEGDI